MRCVPQRHSAQTGFLHLRGHSKVLSVLEHVWADPKGPLLDKDVIFWEHDLGHPSFTKIALSNILLSCRVICYSGDPSPSSSALPVSFRSLDLETPPTPPRSRLRTASCPPFRQLYSLSRPELEALCQWLEDNLWKGFNRQSTTILFVLCCASFGIAALLLPGGRTSHSRFKIPLEITESSMCNIHN